MQTKLLIPVVPEIHVGLQYLRLPEINFFRRTTLAISCFSLQCFVFKLGPGRYEVLKRFHLWMWRTTELFGNLTKDLRFQLSSRARYTLRRPRRSNCQRSNLVVIHHTPALFSKTLSWKRLFGKRMHVKALIDNCITALLWRCLACSEPLFTSSQVPRWSPSWWVSQVLEGCDCPVDTWWLQVSGNHSREWWWEPGPLLSSSIFSASRPRVSHWPTSVSLQTN